MVGTSRVVNGGSDALISLVDYVGGDCRRCPESILVRRVVVLLIVSYRLVHVERGIRNWSS